MKEGGRQRAMAVLLTLGSHFCTNKQQAACGHLHVTGHYYTKYIRKHLPQLVPTPPTVTYGDSSSLTHLSNNLLWQIIF